MQKNIAEQKQILLQNAEQVLQKADEVKALLSISPEDGLVKAIQLTGQSQSQLGRVLSPVRDSLRRAIEVNFLNSQGSVSSTASTYSIAFNPDGQTIATASADGTVRLWRPDGSLIKTLGGSTAAVTSVSFSPDGQTLATASADRTIKLWKLDGDVPITIKGHEAAVNSVSFSPDGQLLVSSSKDTTVRLGNRDNWKTLLEFACNGLHERPVFNPPKTDIAKEAKATCQKYVWNNN